jgi:hypothetical protein
MAIKYINIFQSKVLQKFTQIGIFGLKNKPSGNPAEKNDFSRTNLQRKQSQFIRLGNWRPGFESRQGMRFLRNTPMLLCTKNELFVRLPSWEIKALAKKVF